MRRCRYRCRPPNPNRKSSRIPAHPSRRWRLPRRAKPNPCRKNRSDLAEPSATAPDVPAADELLTTTAESAEQVHIAEEPPEPIAVVHETEQVMLRKNVEKLAQKLLETNTNQTELTWQQEGREYTARVLRQPASDSTGLEQVIAEIMTENDGKRMRTKLSLKRLAFSHFTQLVNHWDPNIRLHDDVIDGRFHSNSEIGLAFSRGIEPRFFGKVTTSAARLTDDPIGTRKRTRQVFQGGTETRTDRVTLPRDMPDVVNGGDESDRHIFAVDTRIIFNADGSFAWRPANGEGELQRADSSQRPRYLIGEKGATLYVSGVVSGIFTVYTPADVEIENDLVYAKDPRDVLISRDFLALIAGTRHQGRERADHRHWRSAHSRRVVRAAAVLDRIGGALQARQDVRSRQPDGGHHPRDRAALCDTARLRPALRVPAPRELPDDPALRGRLVGRGLGGSPGKRGGPRKPSRVLSERLTIRAGARARRRSSGVPRDSPAS